MLSSVRCHTGLLSWYKQKTMLNRFHFVSWQTLTQLRPCSFSQMRERGQIPVSRCSDVDVDQNSKCWWLFGGGQRVFFNWEIKAAHYQGNEFNIKRKDLNRPRHIKRAQRAGNRLMSHGGSVLSALKGSSETPPLNRLSSLCRHDSLYEASEEEGMVWWAEEWVWCNIVLLWRQVSDGGRPQHLSCLN